jgi:hypothetical protein
VTGVLILMLMLIYSGDVGDELVLRQLPVSVHRTSPNIEYPADFNTLQLLYYRLDYSAIRSIVELDIYYRYFKNNNTNISFRLDTSIIYTNFLFNYN